MNPPAGKIRILFGCDGWPSGVLEIASWAVREGLAEAVIHQIGRRESGEADFVARLRAFRPHVVGFRVEGGQFDRICRWVRIAREACEAEIVLGGPTATSHPLDVLARSGADYVFAGEAEESFALFLRLARGRNSKDLRAEVPGLVYRHAGRVLHNTLPADGYGRTVVDTGDGLPAARRRALHNLVRPLPGQDVLQAARPDWSLLQGFDEPVDALYFTGGRGCPGVCAFCARLHGSAVRAKSAEQLLAEIEGADARVAAGALRVTRWRLFEHVADEVLRPLEVAWAAVYDEDFFLARDRAVEFFRLWEQSPLRRRYRLSVQTNPCSMLRGGRIDAELLGWIDRLKPMIQLGAESFHEGLLARWRKRHNVDQLETVLDALDATRQDYTVFQLLTDFESAPEEVVDAVWLLVQAARRHRRMRIASSALMIPLYESDVRRRLEFGGRLPPGRIEHFTDYERPHAEWMDPLAAELAERADEELQFALQPEHRDAALEAAMEAMLVCLRQWGDRRRARGALGRAEWAMERIRESRYEAIERPPR